MATLGNFTAAILTAAELNAIGTWTTWTPTWSNLTVGNGTVVARYSQINKVIHMRVNLAWGSTTSISGSVTLALPVTASSTAATTGHGVAQFGDASASQYLGVVRLAGTTTAQLVVPDTSGTYPTFVGLSSTIPFTWVVTDTIDITLTYEAA
jgi:hypothetical protein